MIRLNAFFEVKDGVTTAQVKALTDELVAKSLNDAGNKGYDLFESTTRPGTYMFCETWESDELLDKHSKAPHFTTIVPKIAALTKNGLSLERFEK
jgi:quinol monooxygenase YgiN